MSGRVGGVRAGLHEGGGLLVKAVVPCELIGAVAFDQESREEGPWM